MPLTPRFSPCPCAFVRAQAWLLRLPRFSRLVPAVRERFGQQRWREDWSTTPALLWCARHAPALSGDALGHALPLLFALCDDLDPRVSAPAVGALRHVIGEVTHTEVRWHAPILQVRRRARLSAAPTALCQRADERMKCSSPRVLADALLTRPPTHALRHAAATVARDAGSM